jgi:hypothetical protein
LSVSLVDTTQGAIPGGQVLGEDENDNLIIGRLPSPSQQVIPQSKLHAQKYISTTEACAKELSQWCDQLSAILIHLRSHTLEIDSDEFSEILTQLQFQKDAKSPIYIKDVHIRKLAEDMCPDFEKYSRGKESIEFFSSYDIIPANARKGITEFLQLCSKVEITALKVLSPANYGTDLSAGQSILAEAIFELNELRFELNGRFAVLSHS